jgi:leader peptidase (prepilin peptidase)/N-methyltransferase
MKGRSKCLSCGEALRPYDLIPVVSYFLLKGRCRYCKSTYGISALVIESLFGVTFLLLYQVILKEQPSLAASGSLLVYYTVLFIVLGVMALYDRLHSYIPFWFLVSFITLSLGMFLVRLTESHTLVDFAAPIFVASPFLLVWLITKGKGLGFGDVIIFFGIGAFFGSLRGLAVLFISVWVGALFGLYYKYVVKKKQTSTTAIPFVPFIVVAFLVVLFTGIDIISIAMLFS